MPHSISNKPKKVIKNVAANLTLGAFLLTGASAAIGQNAYPTKSVRIITTDAGGSSDFFLRGLAEGLTKSLGETFFVENHEGSGAIPGEIVSRANPDGYTLLFFTMNVWVTPLLQKTTYDPVKDLAPITLASKASSVLVVTPNLPVKNVQDLINLAKSKPGDVVYAHGSDGSASHMTGAMFRSMTGVKFLNVPYKGSAQALLDVAAGRAQAMFPNAAVVPPLVAAGKIRAIAVSSPERSPFFSDLPSVAETIPGFASSTTNGMFAPAKTPDAIIMRLNQAANAYIHAPETKARLAKEGVEGVGSTPQEFAKYIKEDMVRWAKVIKDENLQVKE